MTSWWRHLVADYTGLDFHQVGELELIQYLTWRRDAYIYLLTRTEEGQEYLDNCWRMEQTDIDRVALRRKLGKEGPEHGR